MTVSLHLNPSLRERLRLFRAPQAPKPPKPEQPYQHRDRLRKEVQARGGVLTEVETITGDCPAQTAQQIRDLSAWLERTPRNS